MFSSRDPHGEHANKVRTETGAAIGLPAEVLAFSDVIAIAMPSDAAMQVAKEHAGQWNNKVIKGFNIIGAELICSQKNSAKWSENIDTINQSSRLL